MNMMLSAALASLAVCGNQASETETKGAPEFETPRQLFGGGEPVRTEDPGYAAPELYDVDGDGHKDLVVGQFAGGKIAVYPGAKDGTYGAREWLKAGNQAAEVPGVW